MEILFCYLNEEGFSQPIDWKEEADAAEECGFRCHSFSYDLFWEGQIDAALDELPDGEGTEILYRGWMMPEDEYSLLEDGLSNRNYRLMTATHEYRETLLMPNYFELVEEFTMPCLWTDDPDIDEAWELAQSLGKGPWIVRDHMKSAKEAWLEACYVPEGADYDQFKSVCEELRNRREPYFTNGYVIRPFVPLNNYTAHWTGAPVSEEYRMIFWHGKPILTFPYHDLGSKEQTPDLSHYHCLGDKIDSRFFVADVAVTEAGDPILIELNSGGIAGFPPQMHPIEFYEEIKES